MALAFRLPAAAAAALLLALPAAAQVSQSVPDAPAVSKGGFVLEERAPLTEFARDTLKRVNALRAAGARCGTQDFAPAAALAWNVELERAAEVHVRDIAQSGNFSHTGSDGSEVGARVTRESYRWSTVGENIAAGNPTAPGTLTQWMNSPGHCRNLMGARYIDLAVAGARVPGKGYEWYWVMVLASPMGGR